MDLQTFATSALVATFASVALNRAIEWQKSAAHDRAQLRGILLELAHAQHCIERFEGNSESPSYLTPVYRIATQFLGSSIEALAARGTLKRTEAELLHRFYIESEETNKTLDTIAALSGSQLLFARGTDALNAAARAGSLSQLANERFRRIRRDLPAARAAAEAALARVAWYEQQE